ncbi:DUF4179 domain-containing protein [Paenibacillus tritici]|uniref:DUF4179 domain-containing protein n=1 Tax=Paenibacillus tritici TaxID=1873425 RepID=A0ABX2E0C6_9BACL|nr:DUF4179 domain-containing protein [Paenibacillus tritici]NQX49681.1 DUF4179 domain-containing protein [Paenibacillus tritici]
MRTIEERLQEHQQTRTPSELEGRLRKALEQAPARQPRSRIRRARTWVAASAAALLLTVGVYQYPALAYYGGKLFSQSELNTVNFAQVVKEGYGQAVNQSKTLKDGTIFTIKAVIADDNNLLMHYSIQRPPGLVFDETGFSNYSFNNIKGLFTDSDPTGGGGDYSPDKTRFEGVYKFEPVSPFSKKLTVNLNAKLTSGEIVHFPISFKYDPNLAMKSLLVADIDQAVPVDEGKVFYDSITASPTSTIVKGHYEMDNGEIPRFPAATKLYVNGTEVNMWSMRSGLNEKTKALEFQIEFDVLPTDKLQTVELVLDNFIGYQTVEQPISLASPSDRSVPVGNEKLWIRSVTKTAEGYDIVIAGKQFTMLDKDTLAVQAAGAAVPVTSISDFRSWDLKNGNILWERTYSFQTTDKPQFLLMDGFDYIKFYRQTVPVPLGDAKH